MTFAGAAKAYAQATAVRIEAGSLSSSLQDLQRQTGVELLFDPSLVSGLDAPPVHGNLNAEDALRQLLDGTGLMVRRAQSGAWIVERPNTPLLQQQDTPAPEIVVTGKRTHNVDIRRFETDVQPYVVVTQQELRAAHRDNLDQYFNTRVTPNSAIAPSGLDLGAVMYSGFDLRGLGTGNTLVLVDGRRVPGLTVGVSRTDQPDVNAISLHAIERVEILTGASGGIHGNGALGGVVNVVLDRDDRGFEVFVTESVSSRGDARRERFEARYGATSADERTNFTVFASHTSSEDLRVGQRDFAVRDRRRTYELAPDLYTILGLPYGDSVTVRNLFGAPLQLRPEFGGGTLTSDISFLPSSFSGDAAEFAAILAQNAGQLDFSISQNNSDTDLLPRARTESLLLNLRHRFAGGLEAYADALLLHTRAEFDDMRQAGTGGFGILGPDSPANPFTDYVVIYFPIERLGQRTTRDFETSRYTVGVMGDLPFGWRGAAELTHGVFRYDASATSAFPGSSTLFLLGDPSDPDIQPFGDWETFQDILTTDPNRLTIDNKGQQQIRNLSLRMAGPVFDTGGGQATLTLLAERRSEDVPAYSIYQSQYFGGGGAPFGFESVTEEESRDTTSFYGELRVPFSDDAAPLPFLRDLELQLAVRYDDFEVEFQRYANSDNLQRRRIRFPGTAYTAGLKVSPTQWLMLRGSYATGEQPPNPIDLREVEDEILIPSFTTDPRRGNLQLDTPLLYRNGGNADLDPLRATSFFLGAVLTPFGDDSLRVAIDYSRVRREGDTLLAIFDQEVIDNEQLWPERVVRGPLTPEDEALGYTGGPIIVLDSRLMNGGTVEAESLDLRVDWPVSFLGGRLRFYADATYNISNEEQVVLQPPEEWVGYYGGPLEWRANGGMEWSNADLTFGANVQYFSTYSILTPGTTLPDFTADVQGSDRIEAQAYLDVYAGWRLPSLGDGPLGDVTLEFGIINALDRAPPRETAFGFGSAVGQSRYGDPRQRRFELVLSSRF